MSVASVVVDNGQLEACVMFAIATASIAMTLTKTPLFNFIRDRIEQWPMIHHLWGCPYCMAHWIALMWILIYRPEPFGLGLIDLFPAWFFTTTIAAFLVQALLIGGGLVNIVAPKPKEQDDGTE